MRIVEVESPEDILYPLDRKLFEDPRVVYHGTSKLCASKIERNGWARNALPDYIQDVEAICRIYESLKFYGLSPDGYPVLKAFSLGASGRYSRYKPATFSASYWCSRNYASQPGGEAVASIVRAAVEIELLVTDDQLLEEHKNKLQDDLARLRHRPDHLVAEDEAALDHLADPQYLSDCVKEAMKLRDKYEAVTHQHLAVVYAVRVEPQWFEQANSSEWHSTPPMNQERSELLEIRPRPGVSIPPDTIVARVDFPNGVAAWSPFAGYTLPLPWLMSRNGTKKLWDRYRRAFGTPDS